MTHVSLYRRYRPLTFDTFIGQSHIIKTLKNTVLSGQVSHAYLFTGTRGTGKTSAAKIFARAINCLSPKADGSPCGKCSVCKELIAPNNMDILEIDAASNNGVDEIRDLREKIKYPPTNGKYKVYIIDEVHMLTLSAFNALLKTLEEPPAHAVFILATTEVHKIPQTILSRCMRFDFRLLSMSELVGLLKTIFADLKKDYEKEALTIIAEAGDGSVRDTLSIADMCITYCDGAVRYQDVLEVLGACSPMLVAQLVDNMMNGDIQNALIQTNKITTLGKSVELLAKDISKALRAVLYCKNCANANAILNLPNEIYLKYQGLSNACSNNKILRAIDIFVRIESTLRYTTNPKIILEMSIVKSADVTVSIDNDGILQRLKEVESKVRESISNGNVANNLQPKAVWGYVLNKLQADPTLRPCYVYCSKIDENKLQIDKDTFIISLKSEGEALSLNCYLKDIENLIIQRYFELTKVKINTELSEDKTQQGIQQIKNLFGSDNVKIK